MRTQDYVPKLAAFPTNMIVRLCPVRINDLVKMNYAIDTYLNNDVNTIGQISKLAATGDKVLTFPAASPAVAAVASIADMPKSISGLCNLKEVFPRIASVNAQYTWDFVISEANTTYLSEKVNVNSGKKCFNEFSIYVDPRNYARDDNIWCLNEGAYVPCEFNLMNFINVRFNKCLTTGTYSIVIIGLMNPSNSYTTTEVEKGGSEDSKFDCSVNFFENDSRENLLIGKGNNAISSYTKPTGSFVYYTPSKMVSNTNPNEIGNYELDFTFDFTQNLTTIPKTFKATADSGNSVMLVEFPFNQYDFFNYSGTPTVSLTYFVSKVNTITEKIKSINHNH